MIRRYADADLTELLDVWYEASRVAHAFLPEEFFDREREKIRDEYLPAAETWVFEEDGRVVGFLSLVGDELGAIFVRPEWQGGGLGSALLDHARSRRDRLVVEVFAANEHGRAFYDARGFRPVGERPHEETGQSLLRLQLDG